MRGWIEEIIEQRSIASFGSYSSQKLYLHAKHLRCSMPSIICPKSSKLSWLLVDLRQYSLDVAGKRLSRHVTIHRNTKTLPFSIPQDPVSVWRGDISCTTTHFVACCSHSIWRMMREKNRRWGNLYRLMEYFHGYSKRERDRKKEKIVHLCFQNNPPSNPFS